MEQSLIIPDSRNSFIDHVKVRLGHPEVKLNVSRLQIEIRIEEALKLYKEWHDDATDEVFIAHQITADDVTNQEFQFPLTTHRVTGVVSINGQYGTKNTIWFPGALGLQSFSNPFYMHSIGSFGQHPLTMIYLRKQYHAEINFLLKTRDQFSFDFHNKILRIKGNLDKIIEGNYVVAEASVEKDGFWSDDWLIRYTTELIRLQWGENMSKFDSVVLPNGISINGTDMASRAKEEIEKLKTEVVEEHGNYSFIITG